MGFYPKSLRASKDPMLTQWPKWLLKMATQISFQTLAGVLQDDTLALYLFIIVLDYVMKMAMTKDSNFEITLHQQRRRCCLAVCLTDADFADDIALLSDTMNEAQ